MANQKMEQKAGDNAQQIQGQTVNIYNGISEKDVRKICSDMTYKAMERYSAESYQTVEKRINDFAEILIPRIEKIENGFESFADPEFQLELTKSQVSAACTDKEADYEMLSELLAHRIEKSDNRRIKASISKAVEIVDKIEEDGLCGLTVAYAVLNFFPVSGIIKPGLEVIDNMYSKLISTNLPTGDSWMSYLDILDVIRVSFLGSFGKFENILYELFSGYTVVGIRKESEEYKKAIEYLQEASLSEKFLVDHELLDGYVRIPLAKLEDFQSLKVNRRIEGIGIRPVELIDKEKIALEKICNMYSNDMNLKKEVTKNFIALCASYTNIKQVSEWWNSLKTSFTITPIGNVLAHANAKRYIDIPELLI